MFEDSRLTADPPSMLPFEGVDRSGHGGSVALNGPGVASSSSPCPPSGVGHHPPQVVIAVSDILQQALAEVSNDQSGSIFGGEAAGLEGGTIAIASLANSHPDATRQTYDIVGSVAPELLGLPNVKILSHDRLFVSAENESTFSYLMETESGVEKPGISEEMKCAADDECVQNVDEDGGNFPTEYDEGEKMTTPIETDGSVVEPVVSPQILNISECSSPNFPSKAAKDGSKTAPLGSSQNPIRIVQQGNKYKSLQNLTPEQLSQIMQVVQQQQLIRSSKETGQASVLYNPQTQTKIIFRVVNPSEMQKGSSGLVKTIRPPAKKITGTLVQNQNLKNLKKARQKKKLRAEQKDVVHELKKEVRNQKKTPRQRTRYGRLSRPPQYMVSDYKRINRVDYDEDDEDSEEDENYSDFQDDDSENEGTKSKNKRSVFINANHSDQGCLKPRKHSCYTCEKSYIGFKGLARHLRLNPSHDAGNGSSDAGNLSVSNCDATPHSAQDSPSADNFNETASCDSNQEMSRNLTTEETPATDEETIGMRTRRFRSALVKVKSEKETSSTPVVGQDQKKRKRGRPPATDKTKTRRDKLQELVDQCTDDELLRVVMPRIGASVSMWDFLLLKTTNENSQLDPTTMLSEFEEFHRQIGSAFQENLVLAQSGDIGSECEKNGDSEEKSTSEEVTSIKSERTDVEICDDLARCFGLTPGSYRLKEEAPLFAHSLFVSSPVLAPETPVNQSSHIDEMVSQGQVATLPLRKRLRLTENASRTSPTEMAIKSSGGTGQSDGDWNMLPGSEPVASAEDEAGDDAEAKDGNLCSDSDVLLGKSATKEDNSLSADALVDSGEKGSIGDSDLCVPDSGEPKFGVLTVSAGTNGGQYFKQDGDDDNIAAAVVSETASEVKYGMQPFQSNNFPGIYSSNGSQLVDNCTPSDVAEAPQEFLMVGGYYTNEVNRLTDQSSLTTAAAATLSASDLQPVVDSASPDKSCGLLVAGEQGASYRDLFAGIGYIVQGPAPPEVSGPAVDLQFAPGTNLMERNYIPMSDPEFTQAAARMVESGAQDCNAGDNAGIQQVMQVTDAAHVIPTSRDLVIVQNSDGTIMIHGQPGQDIPLEMVQTLMSLDQSGQVIFQDSQQGYVVDAWNQLK